MKKAAFFDRDGTINIDFGHVHKVQDIKLINGIPSIIRRFNEMGWPVLVITNQAGIAKGIYTEKEMHIFNEHLNMLLSFYGAHIDKFYFCPHHPDYTGHCLCRKPNPGLFYTAAKEFDIDLNKSVMFGDKETDRQAAYSAGIKKFILVNGNRIL